MFVPNLLPSDLKWCGALDGFVGRILSNSAPVEYTLDSFIHKNYLIFIYQVVAPTRSLKSGMYIEVCAPCRKTFFPSQFYYKEGNTATIIENVRKEIDRIISKGEEFQWRYSQLATQEIVE